MEVKCPYGHGSPSPHEALSARQLPQLQGAMLATGAAHCHLVSWSPLGTNIFWVPGSATFQAEMVHALALFARPTLDEAKLEEAGRAVRLHSQALARRAECVGRLPMIDCVLLGQAGAAPDQ